MQSNLVDAPQPPRRVSAGGQRSPRRQQESLTGKPVCGEVHVHAELTAKVKARAARQKNDKTVDYYLVDKEQGQVPRGHLPLQDSSKMVQVTGTSPAKDGKMMLKGLPTSRTSS